MAKKQHFTLNNLNYLPIILVSLIIVIGLIAFSLFYFRGEGRRDFARRQKINDIALEVNKFYEYYEKYPEVVFFTNDAALICTQVNCINQSKLDLDGFLRPVIDNLGVTTKNQTKYGYNFSYNGYVLGYCDEKGEIVKISNGEDVELFLNCKS